MPNIAGALFVATIYLALAVSPQSTATEPTDPVYESSGDLKQRLDGGSGMLDEVIDALNAMIPAWTDRTTKMTESELGGSDEPDESIQESEQPAITDSTTPEVQTSRTAAPTVAAASAADPTTAPSAASSTVQSAATNDAQTTTTTAPPTAGASPSATPSAAPSAAPAAKPTAPSYADPYPTLDPEEEQEKIKIAALFTVIIWGMAALYGYRVYIVWRRERRIVPFQAWG